MHHVTAASLRSVPSPPVRTRLPTLVKKQPREAVVGVWMRVAASIKLCAALMRAHGFMCVDTSPVRARGSPCSFIMLSCPHSHAHSPKPSVGRGMGAQRRTKEAYEPVCVTARITNRNKIFTNMRNVCVARHAARCTLRVHLVYTSDRSRSSRRVPRERNSLFPNVGIDV